MKIIGAGFGRTGTLSLKAALETLGFGPCYHMVEVFENVSHIALWQALAEGKVVDWQAVYGKYNAAVDWPTCAFYESLRRFYPEAKVLLTVRDPEKWYASVRNTIYGVGKGNGNGDGPAPPPLMQQFAQMVNTLIWQGTFGGRFEDKRYTIDVYKQHNERVKARVPADKLLVFDVQEGWEPLCAFLDVPVPDGPFPRLNDSASFPEMAARVTARLSG